MTGILFTVMTERRYMNREYILKLFILIDITIISSSEVSNWSKSQVNKLLSKERRFCNHFSTSIFNTTCSNEVHQRINFSRSATTNDARLPRATLLYSWQVTLQVYAQLAVKFTFSRKQQQKTNTTICAQYRVRCLLK